MMKEYRYTASGLDNVVLVGLSECVDDDGDACVTIPNINELHRAIAAGIVTHPNGISGKEMRFLRTEMGMTQAELAKVVSREPLAIGRWERGEHPIDPNAEALIRLLARDRLRLDLNAGVDEISGWCVPTADPQPIRIDASNPDSYRPAA